LFKGIKRVIMGSSTVIAVTGKGGTGKTVLATIMIGMLAKRYPGQILAIEADSASSLPYTLGVTVEKTVSEFRKELSGSRQLQASLNDTPSKEIMRSLLTPCEGFDLLTMGRPEGAGCFCAVNDLLKLGITILAEDYLVAIIDGEAGPEQLNRRVVESVDVLLVMADMSRRSIATAAEIMKVAQGGENPEIAIKKAGLVLNRVKSDVPERALLKNTGLDVLAELPEDALVNTFDREGKSLMELPEDSPCPVVIKALLEKIIPGF